MRRVVVLLHFGSSSGVPPGRFSVLDSILVPRLGPKPGAPVETVGVSVNLRGRGGPSRQWKGLEDEQEDHLGSDPEVVWDLFSSSPPPRRQRSTRLIPTPSPARDQSHHLGQSTFGRLGDFVLVKRVPGLPLSQTGRGGVHITLLLYSSPKNNTNDLPLGSSLLTPSSTVSLGSCSAYPFPSNRKTLLLELGS